MKFLKALVVCMVISLPLIYGYSTFKNKSWQLAMGVTGMGQMPAEISESSGLEMGAESGTFFTHNDRSNTGSPELFKIDKTGKLLKTYPIKGAGNEDWEDLTKDSNGFLYIGDIGNNNGNRKTLSIYKVSITDPGKAETINFSYDQSPEKSGKKGKGGAAHNAEALFWNSGRLYVITKDNGKSGTAHIFELPDSPGNHTAKLISSKDLGDKVTGADLSPDGSKLALMGIGKLLLFTVTDGDYFKHKPQTINLGNVGQTEGLVFTDNKTIVFSNESGQLYRYNF